jgi:hypothetical protein
VSRADNLTTFMCRLSINLGASTSWNLKGLSRTVMGLLYLLPSEIKSVKSIIKLKKILSNLLLEKSFYSVEEFMTVDY